MRQKIPRIYQGRPMTYKITLRIFFFFFESLNGRMEGFQGVFKIKFQKPNLRFSFLAGNRK